MTTVRVDNQENKIPLVARFAATCYDYTEGKHPIRDSRISFSPFGEHTNTFAPTTKSGSDNDKVDQQRD